MKDNKRIIYMGTPHFAVESLRALVEGGYQVVGVVTMPDKPAGKHQSIPQPSPVKQYAESAGLTVLQPQSLKNEAFLAELSALDADLQIVVAFRMLPEVVWKMPPLGTINLHASLLPQYRGAAPINWAVIKGEEETGVTTFFLSHEIDTGKIISQRRIPIADDDDAGAVHDALMTAGASLLLDTVDRIFAGKAAAVDQESLYAHTSELRPAPKIFKETCRIDWTQPLKQIYDFIRGLSPYPGAWTELPTSGATKQPPGAIKPTLKIYRSEMRIALHHLPCGTICTDGKTHIDVAVEGGYIRILSLQLAGRKRMTAADFLRGHRTMLEDD
ncbi:MAG: methionyl-tRNA formyltransferase [Tannerellaceae bacterium]|jgi:methionyl-tRNA formyltransferase|nr:methionyl-tRNA formyltransferase [Tannerellaceae bacterium]